MNQISGNAPYVFVQRSAKIEDLCVPHWQFQKYRLICGALIDTRVIAFQSSNT